MRQRLDYLSVENGIEVVMRRSLRSGTKDVT